MQYHNLNDFILITGGIIMLNPYNTTYGSLINISQVETALMTYISTSDISELSFEYVPEGDIKLVFITGYNLEESELPIWEHPIVINPLRGDAVVVVDVRKYIKKITELPTRLSEVVRDINSLEFVILRALLVRDFHTDNVSKHRSIFKPSTTAMGAWISGMVNTVILLNPTEMFKVEIVSSMYANTLYYDKDDVVNNLDMIIARVISSKHIYKLSKNEIREVCLAYTVSGDNSLTELVTNLKAVLPDKEQFITVDSIMGVMGNVWYGPGGSETPIIALEDMATWNALLYSAITNRSYSKSRIGMLLGKHSRVIDAVLVGKHFTNYLTINVV